MRLRVLFTIIVLFAAGILIYQKTSGGNFEKFLPDREQEIQVEDEQAEGGETADPESLIDRELPALPKAPETKSTETKKEISTPGPLVSPTPAPPAAPSPAPEPEPPALTSAGIIPETNKERQANGAAALSTNATLNATALYKANDMCEKQYFAHTSPNGAGAGDLADNFGYDYLSIGENLAYGPFSSDAAVVEAWMNSPGHRANILNSKFLEMGAAAIRCIFNGKNTWLAVQHFGKPASACSRPDAALLATINSDKATLAGTRDRLVVLRAEIEAADPNEAGYADRVDSYNTMVKQYNALLGETRGRISKYNSQVVAFNACAG